MSDFLCFALSTAGIYFFSLVGIEYANTQSKKTRRFLICLIIIAFSTFNGWVLCRQTQIFPIDSVEKLWDEYTKDCKEEDLSWDEFTFPEWLTMEASYQ